ncbi:MAG: hypothetical protein ACI4DY_03550 [Monoglobaceae bacterium]
MITIKDEVTKHQKNFWNNCLFHPTDAVEDAWGKKILDRMSKDKAIKTVRIYTMFEDIVTMDENGNLEYDFRLNDLRLDYLLENNYDILLAYGMMPECIATNKNLRSCMSKNKTRYKGKLINTSTPIDYKLWEDICYTYTKHIIERYGIDVVSKWHVQCFNEPDLPDFFMSDIPFENVEIRAKEYCKLYTAFANGVQKASEKMCFGGPALATSAEFLGKFLDYLKENNVRIDFISLHNYANTGPWNLDGKTRKICVSNWIEVCQTFLDTISEHGFSDTEIIIDEWGMATSGFYNIEECPEFIARETEVFSSYYVKMIYKILEKNWKISKLLICLSGQHEMITDFSGFRNFFTLNFFAKPIYNAYVLASKLYENLLSVSAKNKNIFTIASKSDDDKYSVLLTYSSENFEEDLPETEEDLVFEKDIEGKTATVYCIDKHTTNPYRLYEKMNTDNLGEKEISELREEGNIKPVSKFVVSKADKITLHLTANSVYLVEVE